MGLDKPWEPDWLNDKQDKYVLFTHNNAICSNRYVFGHNSLAFPTEEMRDAFYQNFRDLIEQCKELLSAQTNVKSKRAGLKVYSPQEKQVFING